MRRAALAYAVARFSLFLLFALVINLVGRLLGAEINGVPLILGAFALSSVAGIALFRKQRQLLAQALDDKRRAREEDVAGRRARLESES